MAPVKTIPLAKLEAEFIRHHEIDRGFTRVDAMLDANGIYFLCPKCFEKNGGAVGTHGIMFTFAGGGAPVPKDARGLGPVWNAKGTSIEDLTFVGPGSSSVKIIGGCEWHGFITNGTASILPR